MLDKTLSEYGVLFLVPLLNNNPIWYNVARFKKEFEL